MLFSIVLRVSEGIWPQRPAAWHAGDAFLSYSGLVGILPLFGIACRHWVARAELTRVAGIVV